MKAPILFIFCLLSCTGFSQVPDWVWATRAGGSAADEAVSIKTDEQSNIYTIGNYEEDSLTMAGVTVYNGDGIRGKFISKHAPDGSLVWLRDIPGGGYTTALDVDQKGNCFVTGYFSVSGLIFGADTISSDTNGSYDIFLFKYDKDGNELWGRTAGGKYQEYGYAVKADRNGNIYVAGSKENDTLCFATDTLTNNEGNENALLLKYDSLGHELWARHSTKGFDCHANGVTVDSAGNCYIVGNYHDISTFFEGTELFNGLQDDDIFLVKYSSQGNMIWAKKAGGPGKDWAQAIEMDSSTRIIISGSTAGFYFTMGTLTLPGSNADYFDAYVLKLDTSGTPIWGSRIGGADNERGNAIARDTSGNIFLAGQFESGSVNFGPTTVVNAGGPDMYVVKYTPQGAVQWVKTAGGPFFDIAKSVTVTPAGDIYTCGSFFSDTLDFSTHTLVNRGLSDAFMSRLGLTTRISHPTNNGQLTSIWPNPFTDRIEIANIDDRANYQLLNGIGQPVWSGKNIREKDFGELPRGVYLLNIYPPGGHASMIKLIKR